MHKYFMVSECDGHLYDTRVVDWSTKPLRLNYGRVQRDISGNTITLRAAIRTKFAFPGGYELFGITSDGGVLCCDCMRREYYQIAYSIRNKVNDGWHVVGVETAANIDQLTVCDHCGKTIVDGEDE